MDPADGIPPLPALISGSRAQALRWWHHGGIGAAEAQVLLLLAGTESAAVAGISAAGSTPASRRLTAAADAELLLLGPAAVRPHALPPLPAGVSPALISQVVIEALQLPVLVVDLGLSVPPTVPHLHWAAQAPARCLSSGRALDRERVQDLISRGKRLGRGWARQPRSRPLLVAECVPGGTSTALAVLLGLGIEADGLVSGSLRQPAHGLKRELARRGLQAAGLLPGPGGSVARASAPDPLAVLAAVGDPMQALALGLLLGLAGSGQPVLLAGGSQMAAVLALALGVTPLHERQRLVAQVAIGTTGWVARDRGSDLSRLLERIGGRYGVSCLALATGLRFDRCRQQALRDFEQGFVKEGVGAGGLALLWERSGRPLEALARACDRACDQLLAQGPSSF